MRFCLIYLFISLFPGNVPRSSASVLYDEYHKTKVRKRHPSYTPPPRLARATLSANGMFSTSSTNAEVVPNRDLLADAHQRFIGETFLLRSQMRDVVEKNIGAICSYPEGSTINRGVSSRLQPQDPLWDITIF